TSWRSLRSSMRACHLGRRSRAARPEKFLLSHPDHADEILPTAPGAYTFSRVSWRPRTTCDGRSRSSLCWGSSRRLVCYRPDPAPLDLAPLDKDRLKLRTRPPATSKQACPKSRATFQVLGIRLRAR